ncbi:MAG: SUMF1/EgtB/PvdO family nonheme iron enzyme, partial [Bacteroidota bacterium]
MQCLLRWWGILVPLLLLLTSACTRKERIQLETTALKVTAPPNTLRIADNFYADQTEVTNRAYREYLSWLARVYGKTSARYRQARPDTSVLAEEVYLGEPYRGSYFSHPAYDHHPIVGLTGAQARAYSIWRTDRVAEQILLEAGWIRSAGTLDSNRVFTRERYLRGGYDWIIRHQALALPSYAIPTVAEWEQLAGRDSGWRYGTDSLSRYNRKIQRWRGCLYHLGEGIYSRGTKGNPGLEWMPSRVDLLSKNVYGLHGVIGNVAELVAGGAVVKGGSWRQALAVVDIPRNDAFVKPTFWIGFRNARLDPFPATDV